MSAYSACTFRLWTRFAALFKVSVIHQINLAINDGPCLVQTQLRLVARKIDDFFEVLLFDQNRSLAFALFTQRSIGSRMMATVSIATTYQCAEL